MKHFMRIAAIMLSIAFIVVVIQYILYIHSTPIEIDSPNNQFEMGMLEEERRIIQNFIESEHTDPKDIPELQKRYLFLSEKIDKE